MFVAGLVLHFLYCFPPFLIVFLSVAFYFLFKLEHLNFKWFKNSVEFCNKELVITHQNIRSMRPYSDTYLFNLSTCERMPDLIVLTQVWIKINETDFYNINGFRITQNCNESYKADWHCLCQWKINIWWCGGLFNLWCQYVLQLNVWIKSLYFWLCIGYIYSLNESLSMKSTDILCKQIILKIWLLLELWI